MAAWPYVVVPVILTALVIRLDAVLVGPYFSFPNLIYGWEGLDGPHWYRRETLRWAVARRFAYPAMLGVGLALFELTVIDSAWAGVLTAGLLLWPALFHGLPYGVARRDWQVPALYLLVVLIFGALAASGWYFVEMLRTAAGDRELTDYLFELLREWFVTAVGASIMIAFFRGTFLSLRQKVWRRQGLGLELDFDGNSAYLDRPPDH